jgi:hypothetical protein
VASFVQTLTAPDPIQWRLSVLHFAFETAYAIEQCRFSPKFNTRETGKQAQKMLLAQRAKGNLACQVRQ